MGIQNAFERILGLELKEMDARDACRTGCEFSYHNDRLYLFKSVREILVEECPELDVDKTAARIRSTKEDNIGRD